MGIDWDPVLRAQNRHFDRLVLAMKTKNRAPRHDEFKRIEIDIRSIRARTTNAEDVTKRIREAKDPANAKGELVADVLMSLEMDEESQMLSAERVSIAMDRVKQLQKNFETVLALSTYRLDTGSYPMELVGLVPKYLPGVPTDLFTGNQLAYTTNGKSYRLYSFGPDGKDDDGRGPEDTPPGDDLTVLMPIPDPRRP